jgi:hypothetical protein
MTEDQKALIAELKGDPEFTALIQPDDLNNLKSALSKERDARKQLEKDKAALETAKENDAKKALIEQGKYKDLYETTLKELEALKPLTEYKAKYDEVIQIRKNEILERIPEDKRESYKNFDISVLEIVSKDLQATPKVPNSPGAEITKKQGEEFDITKMTSEQIFDLANKNPQAYFELYNKRK